MSRNQWTDKKRKIAWDFMRLNYVERSLLLQELGLYRDEDAGKHHEDYLLEIMDRAEEKGVIGELAARVMKPKKGESVEAPTLERLLDVLQEFIEDTLKDSPLFVKQEGWDKQPLTREAEVSQMVMPDPDEEHERIPYVLLQLLNGSDKRDEHGRMVSKVNVRIVIVIYNKDKWEGRMQVLRMVQSIRQEIFRAGVIGNMFAIDNLEYLVYPDEQQAYHTGELSTDWLIPSVDRDLSWIKNS